MVRSTSQGEGLSACKTDVTYWQSKRYSPVLVALKGSALWGNTLATALLHDQNWTIPFGLIVLHATVGAVSLPIM